jgi:hypothetical protein
MQQALNGLQQFDQGHGAILSLRDKVVNALVNPRQTMQNIGQGIRDKHAAHQALDKQAFADPRHPFQVTDQAALGQLADNGLALLGPAPVGIFAGLASKTLDPKALVEASQMTRKGADPAEIWWKTGFGKAPDGQWRYEIDDSQAGNLNLRHSSNFPDGSLHIHSSSLEKMPDVQPHPELYAAYPKLQTIAPNFSLQPMKISPGQGHGSYSAGPAEQGFAGGNILAVAGNRGELANIGLHELQHAVQRQQAWQGGANPRMFMPKGQDLHGPGSADVKREAMRRYRRAAGEAEARLVQHRQHLNPAERRAEFPFAADYFTRATGVAPDQLLFNPDIARILTQNAR